MSETTVIPAMKLIEVAQGAPLPSASSPGAPSRGSGGATV
jgi:hypothetical protein